MEEFCPNLFLKLSDSQQSLVLSLSLSDGQGRPIHRRTRFTKTVFIPSLLFDGSHLFQVIGQFFKTYPQERPNVIQGVPVKQKVSLGFGYRQAEIINTCSEL